MTQVWHKYDTNLRRSLFGDRLFRTIPRPAPTLPKPHYPSQIANTLASLVKGRWIDGKAQTVDLLRLLAVYPPFYTTSFSAVKTEGLSRNPRLYQPFQNRTILRKALYPCPPSKKGEVLLLGQAEPTMVGIVNALVVFMVVLLSIPIPSHRTTPSKTALSHSLFVGRGACPSRNITAIIENKLIELYCKT